MSLSFRHAAFTVALLFMTSTVHAKTASEIYEQAARSTVVVENINDKGEIAGLGSGVVLPNGSVVTNCHVIKDASQLKVRSNKNKFPALLQFVAKDFGLSLGVGGNNTLGLVVSMVAPGLQVENHFKESNARLQSDMSPPTMLRMEDARARVAAAAKNKVGAQPKLMSQAEQSLLDEGFA